MADEMVERGNKVIKVDFQPTCEMLVIDFAEKIKRKLPSNIALYSLKLTETATAYAEWYESDN
jgi:6-pyruvoyltetrahydropterin/6-carboxytetrahydropterin synthase